MSCATKRILIVGEIPSGVKNGSNVTFSLSNTPVDPDSARVCVGGFRLARVVAGPSVLEYTLSGSTLTMGLAPLATDSFFADYVR